MQKKIYKIILNTLIFIAFSYFMPGITINNGPFAHILIGIGYGLVYISVPSLLHFFKLPNTIVLKILAGLVLISGYLFLLVSQVPGLITVAKGYIGSTNFIIFTSPRLISLDSEVSVIMASAIILFVCSIIIEKLKK